MNLSLCPVCKSIHVKAFLQRSGVPVHQNLLMSNQEAALKATRGELKLSVCENCGFVFNQTFDLSLLSYGQGYDNTQSCSAYFDAYLDDLVKYLVEKQGVRNCTIVEVGCGKGHFLRKLINYPGANNIGYGFDPSYIGPLNDVNGRLNFRRCYYDQNCTDITADIVVCRHVIEHIPNPLEMLYSVRAALKSGAQTRVFFETPCVNWILRNKVTWDFFYEHCSLFTAESLKLAFQYSGFNVTRVKHVFKGQYLWLEAKVANAHEIAPIKNKTLELAKAYAIEEHNLIETWLLYLYEMNQQGKLAIWGAGAKGATFANLVDPNATIFDCVIDINPNKHGHYIPGSGHLIVSPLELINRGISTAILMNPNYREESLQLLEKTEININLIDWS